MKGFLAGVLFGTVVVTLGLAVLSEVAPKPGGRSAEPGRVVVDVRKGQSAGVSIRTPDVAAEAAADTTPPAVKVDSPSAAPEGTTMPDGAAEPASPPVATDDAADAPAAPRLPDAEPTIAQDAADDPVMDPPVAVEAPVADTPTAPAPVVNAVAPDAPVGPASALDPESPLVVADAPPAERAPAAVAAPAVDASPAASDPPPPALAQTVTEAALVPDPVDRTAAPAVAADAAPAASMADAPAATLLPEPTAETAPQVVEPAPQDGAAPPPDGDALVILPVPDTPPATMDADMPEAVAVADPGPAPLPGLDGLVDGVTTGRLPRIGAQAAAGAASVPADRPPLQRYARDFENPDGKPAFAIVLIDQGLSDADRARLAALPFPITFALDPTMPQVAKAAAAYVAAGQEVAMLATGIPPGATAADLEVTFAAHARALPEAVVVLDLETGGFQTDRVLATQVVPVIAGQGRGVVTWDGGLNAGAQVAQRDGVAAGTVFRRFDPDSASVQTMRRMLDRAAFKAAQDGRVIVVGNASAELTVALLAWSLEGRAASVALAPVSAVLTKPAG